MKRNKIITCIVKFMKIYYDKGDVYIYMNISYNKTQLIGIQAKNCTCWFIMLLTILLSLEIQMLFVFINNSVRFILYNKKIMIISQKLHINNRVCKHVFVCNTVS